MNNNEQKKQTTKKGNMSTLLIILLITIILAASSIGMFAWARIRKRVNGTATAQVARWSFKLVDGVVETSDVIDFAVTRTDDNPNVSEGSLAPGTYGEFEIGIDARGTETILEYDIELALVDKPGNLKLYKDSAKTDEILLEDNILTLNGFMSLEDVKEVKVEKIYWEWPYQTGETEEEQLENDLLDSEFLGKTMTMEIAVTGTEILEQVIYLADVVEIGDFVNYNASSNGTKTFTKSDCLTGSNVSATISTDDSFNSDAKAQWRVFSVDRANGIIELISTDPTIRTVTLTGGDGFVNAETVLNNVAAIYGQGKGATGGRSITVEDVERYSSYVAPKGETRTYSSGNFYKEIKDTNGNVIQYENTITEASSDNKVEMTQTSYSWSGPAYIENTTIQDMIFKNTTSTSSKVNYWLASRCVSLYSSYCHFYVRCVMSNTVNNGDMGNSRGYNSTIAYAVVPLVSLESNIQTTGQDDNGVWQLKVD